MATAHCPNCGFEITCGNIAFSVAEYFRSITTEMENEILRNLFQDPAADAFWTFEAGSEIKFQKIDDISYIDLSFLGVFERFGITENLSETLSGKELSKNVITAIRNSISPLRGNLLTDEYIEYVIECVVKKYLPERIDCTGFYDYYQPENLYIPRVLKSSTPGLALCQTKRCSRCAKPISSFACTCQEKIIALIGAPYAGKTAYITSVISEMTGIIWRGENIFESCGITIECDTMSEDYKKMFTNALEPYKYGFSVLKTDTGEFPQVSVKITSKRSRRTFLYTFVDIPGEVFQVRNAADIQRVIANREVVKYASAVWFCISSATLYHHALEKEVQRNTDNANHQIINIDTGNLNNLANSARNFFNAVFSNREIPPILFIMTKADLLNDCPRNAIPRVEKDFHDLIWSDAATDDTAYFVKNPTVTGVFFSEKYITMESNRSTKAVLTYGLTDTAAGARNVFFDGFQNYGSLRGGSYPVFSVASYGRDVDTFSFSKYIQFLIENIGYDAVKESCLGANIEDLINLPENQIDDMIYLDNLVASGKLSQAAKERLLRQNQFIRPLKPFGVAAPMLWTLIYTGLIDPVVQQITADNRLFFIGLLAEGPEVLEAERDILLRRTNQVNALSKWLPSAPIISPHTKSKHRFKKS